MLPELDLNVLGIPPAFVLSQDQTLHKMVCFMFSSPMKTLSFKIKVLTRFKHVECINIRLSLLDIYCCFCSVFNELIISGSYRARTDKLLRGRHTLFQLRYGTILLYNLFIL